MTAEQVHEEVLNLRAGIHKELGDFKYDLTWRLISILGVQTVIILGAVHFLVSDLKGDLREFRTKITQQQKTP